MTDMKVSSDCDLFKQDPVLRAQVIRVSDGGQTVEREDRLAVDAADGGGHRGVARHRGQDRPRHL